MARIGELHMGESERDTVSPERAELVLMDRWKVEVCPRRHLRIRLPRTTINMNNYLSIGVDALVTYNFHKVSRTVKQLPASCFRQGNLPSTSSPPGSSTS